MMKKIEIVKATKIKRNVKVIKIKKKCKSNRDKEGGRRGDKVPL